MAMPDCGLVLARREILRPEPFSIRSNTEIDPGRTDGDHFARGIEHVKRRCPWAMLTLAWGSRVHADRETAHGRHKFADDLIARPISE